MRLRPALFWHRWFGVLGGVWLFLIALTGSILVFYGELDRALNPGLFEAPAAAANAPLRAADAMRQAEAQFPGAQATYARLPRWSGDSMLVYLADRAEAPGAVGEGGREVFADPATGAVLGSRKWGAFALDPPHLMPFVYKLHYSLHAGITVTWLLGILSLLWLIDHFVAVPLALRSAKSWRASFRLRRGAHGHKRNFDLHRAAGMWLLPVTAMLAFSGVYFNLYDEFNAVLKHVSAPTPPAAEARPDLPAPLDAPPLDADAALAAIRAGDPGLRPSGFTYDPAKGLWTIYVHDPRDLVADFGQRHVTLDARTGETLGDRHLAQGTVGDVIVAWQYPLHSGKAFGWTGRILILLAGLATCAMVVTGFMLWARRRAARRRTGRRLAPPGRLPPQPLPAE